MKSIIILLSFALLTGMTFKNNAIAKHAVSNTKNVIPNIEFDIQFVGTTTGSPTPTLLVNGSKVTSSVGGNYWSSFVDEANSYGLYNFKSNTCYTLKGVGGVQNLCVTFNPNYRHANAPTIEYNITSKTFKINNLGSNCTLKVGNTICCIYKDTYKER